MVNWHAKYGAPEVESPRKMYPTSLFIALESSGDDGCHVSSTQDGGPPSGTSSPSGAKLTACGESFSTLLLLETPSCSNVGGEAATEGGKFSSFKEANGATRAFLS